MRSCRSHFDHSAGGAFRIIPSGSQREPAGKSIIYFNEFPMQCVADFPAMHVKFPESNPYKKTFLIQNLEKTGNIFMRSLNRLKQSLTWTN